ncbi:MAG: 5'/3'-nucleotidase SurE [bacterium]
MRIFLTNDDGIEAEGLAAIAQVLSEHAEVIVVAPRDHQSCCGHGVTTTRPLQVIEQRPGWYSVDGLPADCVRVGLLHLQIKPDWVVSGINHGGNLGVDILMSGTVAAAREASLLGYRSFAISQYRNPAVHVPWELSALRGWGALQRIMHRSLERHWLWNVNLPAIASSRLAAPWSEEDWHIEIVDCVPEPEPLSFQLEPSELGLVYRSNYQKRPRSEQTDVAHCFGGKITCSKLTATLPAFV